MVDFLLDGDCRAAILGESLNVMIFDVQSASALSEHSYHATDRASATARPDERLYQ
jgi:hypothetical protein